MMAPSTNPNAHPAMRDGFTLVEILVSMAVLVLLLLVIAQLVNSTIIVTTGHRKHMDADSQARLVFDRIGMDIARMVKRVDVDYLFSKQQGNDRMFFYSEAPAYFEGGSDNFKPRSTTALIGYRINSSHQFERLGKLLSWDGASTNAPGAMVFLTYPPAPAGSPSPSPTPLPASLLARNWPAALGSAPRYEGTGTDYHPLAEQVFRFEFCFQLKDGSHANDPARGGNLEIHSLKDISAIVVALAVLDSTSRTIAPADLSKVAEQFDDITDDAELSGTPPVLMLEAWQAKLNSPDFAQAADLPPTAASQVRLYQRSFSLNIN
jgi:prepilin-type N-terminal cleavage/methylation domain-containing protein